MEITFKDHGHTYCSVLDFSIGAVNIFEIDRKALSEECDNNIEKYLVDNYGYKLDQISWMVGDTIEVTIDRIGFKG